MDKNNEKTWRRGPKPKNLITDSPFSIALSRILHERGESNAAVEKRGGVGGGTIKNVLRSGNPTLSTVWALEKALDLPNGFLCSSSADSDLDALKARKIDSSDDADALPSGAIRMIVRRPWQSPEARAAADTSARTQTEELDGMAEPIAPPEDTVLIPVHGRSMEPVLLDNQYAVVDWADGGWKGDGGIYVVEIRDGEEAEPELFVKHCFLRGGEYVLQSVNPEVADLVFPVERVSRMWQVIGTWYMGKGKPAAFKVAADRKPQRTADASPLGAPPLLEIYRSVLSLQKTIADIGHQITLHPNAAKREWLAVQAAVDAAFDLHHKLLEPDSDPHRTNPESGESQSA